MRILIQSPSFFPNIGGVETVALMLARELAARGHAVRVITETELSPARDGGFSDFQVIRTRRLTRLWREIHWSQAYLQMGLSLKGLPPFLSWRTRWAVSHHTWYTPSSAPLNRLKRILMRFATNLYCSKAVAAELQRPGVVVGNAYDHSIFKIIPGATRDSDLVFLGRLVSDKGVDILIEALAILGRDQLSPKLTVIGSGPELENLTLLVAALGLNDQVTFAGSIRGSELAEVLNQHRLLVVPSRWNEPFGIVALEGMACGCVPVGSTGGGLSEAIGACGPLFENGNPHALAESLREMLSSSAKLDAYRSHFAAHLSQYTPHALALRYEAAILATVVPSPPHNDC